MLNTAIQMLSYYLVSIFSCHLYDVISKKIKSRKNSAVSLYLLLLLISFGATLNSASDVN